MGADDGREDDAFRRILELTATRPGRLRNAAFELAYGRLGNLALNLHDSIDLRLSTELALQIQLIIPGPLYRPDFTGARVALWSHRDRCLVVQYGVADDDLDSPHPERYLAGVVRDCHEVFLRYVDAHKIPGSTAGERLLVRLLLSAIDEWSTA